MHCRKQFTGKMLIAVLLASGGVPLVGGQPRPDEVKSAATADTAAEENSWKKVTRPREFAFPADHAAHEEYRVEWWYYTGNVATPAGRRFGFELTFFRAGVDKNPLNPSRWTVRNLYIAHFAISDLREKRFHFFERSRRGGVGWAGASSEHYHVWNGEWQVRLHGEDHLLEAAEKDYGISLRLTPRKPPVLQGDRGLSQKGPSKGNASYYYSLTRMETTGSLVIGGETMPVAGWSWMDHEFSSSFLEEGQQGWDWMALQFESGEELMIYQIRRSDGRADVHSSGTIVGKDGSSQTLGGDEFELVAEDLWRSPETGASYPVAWTVRLPRRKAELAVRAAFPWQEMNTIASVGTPYWEGAVIVTGDWEGNPVRGCGYLEMTGYAGKGLGGIYD